MNRSNSRPTNHLNHRSMAWSYTLLGLILLAGLTLRTWNVKFDKGVGSHPDERSTTCFIAPLIGWPQSWAEFRDPQRSPLNPLWNQHEQRPTKFTYGHFPLYLGVLTGEALHRLTPVAERLPVPDRLVQQMAEANQSCGGVAVAGRLLIALLDTLTILFLFLLGRRIYGDAAGLLAAAFYAFTAQAIQLSHFFAMDPASTTFTVLAVLGAVAMVQDRSWRAVFLTGLGMGLAISSKFSALPILAAPFVATAIVFWQERTGDGRPAVRMLFGLPVALLVAFLAFFVTSPYAVLDWGNFVQATLVEQGQMVRGIADFPFTRQYRNTTPYLYFIQQQVAWGLWWPLGLLALAGTFWAAAKVFLGRSRAGELIVWSWLLPYFGLTGAFLAKFNRYMIPVLPFVLLFAAGLIWTLWKTTGGRAETVDEPATGAEGQLVAHPVSSGKRLVGLTRSFAVLLAVIGIAGGLFWSLAYVNGVYNQEHPWITASRWIAENVPNGSVILCEQWDDCLPTHVPGEPAVNQANATLRRIDWGPYEEDTAEKFEILKSKLRQADYVVYSSKRIYDSVDELPERYPMTNRYYQLMFSGQLGYELVREVETYPRLWGLAFPDKQADESWSLYDHPQVSIFKKVRDLSDAEFAALLGGSWEGAMPWYRGQDSPLSPLLEILGLGTTPASQDKGLINWVMDLLRAEERPQSPQPTGEAERADLSLDRPLSQLPVVDNYRWNVVASENSWLGVGWWWLVVSLLGWLAWPLSAVVFRRLRDRGYLLSKTLGWLLAGWLLWVLASVGWAQNTVVNAWLSVALLGIVSAMTAVWYGRGLGAFIRQNWPLLLVGEALFAGAYLFFVLIRMGNPDLWQPWFGGEKFMEFAFLNGILRSPTFPPVDPHFAGGYINYYYFGIYLVAYLVKLTGIYAEVAFNLAIPTLFALTVVNAFAVAYSATPTGKAERQQTTWSREQEKAEARHDGWQVDAVETTWRSEQVEPTPQVTPAAQVAPTSTAAADLLDIDVARPHSASPTDVGAERWPQSERRPADTADGEGSARSQTPAHWPNGEYPSRERAAIPPALPWRQGLGWALLAPLFVALLGNLDSFAQVARNLAAQSQSQFQSAIPLLETTVRAVSSFWHVLTTDATLPGYDFWAPSRVIPFTINEFPYWSFTFADLHPHLIGIPFSLLFLGLVLALLRSYRTDWRKVWPQGLFLAGTFALLLGTLASVNLWELPTYFGLGVLAFAVSQFRGRGRIDWPLLAGFTLFYLAGAYLLFLPFFQHYANVGASGIGLVRAPDPLGKWLLIWGFFLFVLVGWLSFTLARPARAGDARPTGLERWLSLVWRRFERLPRLLHLQGTLVQHPSTGFLLGILLVPLLVLLALVLVLLQRWILALCLPFLGVAFLLLWRRGRAADPGGLLAALLAATGFAILAGTQVVFLKDFLQGGDYYRMNTLFKFFIQVWVLWGIGAAIAVPRIFQGERQMVDAERAAADRDVSAQLSVHYGPSAAPRHRLFPWWAGIFTLLCAASFAYLVWGTPVRIDQRFPGWRPEIGTLNGLDYMRQGIYTWQPPGQEERPELRTQLHYDWLAIQWLLDNVQGNLVIAESSQLEYYRAGGTRIASLTGLSGLSGMHEGEQRYGEAVGQRNEQLRELWSTPDIERTRELIDQLNVDLFYVGQLERYLHPQAVEKLARMAERGLLTPIYHNEQVTIYAVVGQVVPVAGGHYLPARG